VDINCHCFDPTKTIVFNPAAWAKVEFTNVFNRTEVNTSSTTSPQTAPTCITASGANGACTAGATVVSGFGSINTTSTANYPRQGQLVAQFRF